MKTLFTHLQKVANTPPTYLLVLFAWLLLPFNVSADVTAEWGGWGSYSFPSGGSSSASTGSYVTLTTQETVYDGNLRSGKPNYNTGNGAYIDIDLATGWQISAMGASTYLENGVTISVQFCSTISYDEGAKLGSPIAIAAQAWGAWNNDPPALYDVPSIPDGARSARIVWTGGEGWGGYLYRLVVTITEAAACAAPVTATFTASGAESSGSAPANIDICTDYTSSFTIPGKNTLVYDTKHAFVGWEKDGVTYAEGATYTITDADISAGSIEFTAVWREVNVTDLSITDPVNNTIPLSWKIPGICDLSAYVGADVSIMDNFNGTNSSLSYDESSNTITAAGESGSCGQYGIALPIPATENIETITIDCKGNVDLSSKNVKLWGGVMADGGATYWNYDGNLHWFQPTDWTERTFTIDTRFWNEGSYSKSTSIKYVGVFANGPCGGTTTGISFSVRDVRYHVAGRADIDHIVLVRKAGSVPANKEDGDVLLSNSTKSHFTDTDVKTPGITYYYAVFAVYSDESVSSPVYVSHTMEIVDTYSVTYAKGGEDVTGEVPVDEAEYAENNSVTIAGQNNLARAGYTFGGWNDGSTTYAPGASYTMPAHDVTFTAVWTPFTVPTITNLSLDGVDKTVNLSWNIPGFIDLNTANTTNMNETTYGTTFCAASNWEMNGDELDVTYSCGEWAMCGIAFPLSVDDLESVSFDCRDDNSFSSGGLYPFALADKAYYGSGIDFPHSLAPHSSIFDKYWWNNSLGGATPIDDVTEIAIVSNPPSSVTDGHFFISNLRYHCTGQIDVDHIVLVRKEGEAPSTPTDGSVLHSGAKFTFTDDDETKEAGHTYYYTVFSVHADGSYSASSAVSYTVPAPPALTTYTRENLNVGDFGTICLPYAIEAANREGVELFEIDSWADDGTSMTMSQLNADETMAAGKPYIFQATANTATFRYYEVGEPAEAGSYNGLIGKYVEFELTPNNDNYIIYQNKLYLVNSANVWCGDHRAYIHKGATTPSSAPRRRVTMGLYGTQTATGMDNPSIQTEAIKLMENGVLYILRDGVRYNVMGTKIQ